LPSSWQFFRTGSEPVMVYIGGGIVERERGSGDCTEETVYLEPGWERRAEPDEGGRDDRCSDG
jgi:hypothetical protein